MGSPLVAGSAASPMQTQYVRVLRSFFLDGKAIPVGTTIEVPRHVAAGAIACGKAVAAEPPAPPQPKPVVAEEPVRKSRGSKNVGNGS
jgi:hypothetical protein